MLDDYVVQDTVFDELVLVHRVGESSHNVKEWDVVRGDLPTLAEYIAIAKDHDSSGCTL